MILVVQELLIQSRLGNTEAAPGITSVASIRSKLNCGGRMKASVSEDSIEDDTTGIAQEWDDAAPEEPTGRNTFGERRELIGGRGG